MNQQFNEGKFNYSDLLNMPNVSMIDLSSFPESYAAAEESEEEKERREAGSWI